MARLHKPLSSYDKQLLVFVEELLKLPVYVVEDWISFVVALWRWYLTFIVILIIGYMWMGAYDLTLIGVDIVTGVVAVILDVTSAIASAVNAVASAGSHAMGFLSGGHVGGGSVDISIPSPIDAMQPAYGIISSIPGTCEPMNDWWKVVKAFIRMHVSRKVCYTLRYYYGMPVVYFILYSCVGFLSFNPAPFPWANCAEPEDEDLCAWLRFYLVLIYFVPPAIFWGLFIAKFRNVELLLLRWTTVIVTVCVRELYAVVRLLWELYAAREAREMAKGL